MEIIYTLAASLSALASLGVLAFLLKLVRAYRQLHQEEATFLKTRLDGAERDRDALLDKLKYVGTKESHGTSRSNTPDKKRIFISTPIRGFDDAELIRFVDELSRMIDAMSATRRFDGIFYENHNIRTKEQFEANRWPTAEYFAQLERADVFVAVVPFGSVSGVYFEAGYAAALGKPSIYFVPEGVGKVMPSLMAEAPLLKDYIKTVYFDSLDHVQRVLLERFS